MPKRNELEHQAFQFIMKTGLYGVLQSELWRQLDASSREGSRIAIKLENKGLIRREKELHGGRWTYRLFPKRQPASIDSVINCPCLMCVKNSRCGVWGVTSPNICDKLTNWLLKLTNEETSLQPDPSGDS